MFDMSCCDDMTRRGGLSRARGFGAALDLGRGGMAQGSRWEEDATGKREARGWRAGATRRQDAQVHTKVLRRLRCVDVADLQGKYLATRHAIGANSQNLPLFRKMLVVCDHCLEECGK